MSEGNESVYRMSTPDLREEISRRKMAIWALLLGLVIQLLVLVSSLFLPLATIGIVVGLELVTNTLPGITVEPLRFILIPKQPFNGITVTKFVMAGAIAEGARRLYRLNRMGYPEVELRHVPANAENDETNNDDG